VGASSSERGAIIERPPTRDAAIKESSSITEVRSMAKTRRKSHKPVPEPTMRGITEITPAGVTRNGKFEPFPPERDELAEMARTGEGMQPQVLGVPLHTLEPHEYTPQCETHGCTSVGEDRYSNQLLR
jgi:hypothetical protein